MIAGGKKFQATLLGAENKPESDAGPAFEIVWSQAANTKTGMKMRLPKTVADCIDGSRHFAPSGFREFPNIPPKGFQEINLQDRPRDYRCIS
jgi:hypothetical protein